MNADENGWCHGLSVSSVWASTREPSRRNSETPHFSDYVEAFRYIARREELPTDAGTVFRLAADSSVEVWRFNDIPILYVITAYYYAGGLYDQIRGAQGNGCYYLLRPKNRGVTSAGKLET